MLYPEAMKVLARDVYWLNLGIANAYVLGNPTAFTLVDTGYPGSLPKIEKQLTAGGFSLSNLKNIFITHAHPDHFGSLAAVLERKSVPVWASALEATAIEGKTPLPSGDPSSLSALGRFMLSQSQKAKPPQSARVNHILEHGKQGQDLSELLPGLSAVWLPGHTPGQLGLWLERERLLIGADATNHFLPWLGFPPAAFTSSLPDAKATIRKMADMNPQKLAIGHGAPLMEGADRALETLAKKLKV